METKREFSPDLVLRDARRIIEDVPRKENQYYQLAMMLVAGYEPGVRSMAIEAICGKFGLNALRWIFRGWLIIFFASFKNINRLIMNN